MTITADGNKAIIFDLDDTLYPEIDFVRSGHSAVAEWVAVEFRMDPANVIAEFADIHTELQGARVFDTWLERNGLDGDSVEKMVNIYRNHLPNISLFPDVRALVSRLKSGGYGVGIVTDGWLHTQRNKVTALGLKEIIPTIVYSDLWGIEYWKPHERPWVSALSGLNVAAVNACYVGDNPRKDFIGARALGMLAIRFRHPRGIYRSLKPETEAHAPHYEITSLDQIDETLFQLFSNRETRIQ